MWKSLGANPRVRMPLTPPVPTRQSPRTLNSGAAHLFTRIARLAALASLFVLVNGHFGVLQSIAWARMIWSYSQDAGSLFVGAKQTFDGEHPCSMCHSIREAKHKETPSTRPAAAIKIELFASLFPDVLPERDWRRFEFPLPGHLIAESRSQSPPDPVPIGVSALS